MTRCFRGIFVTRRGFVYISFRLQRKKIKEWLGPLPSQQQSTGLLHLIVRIPSGKEKNHPKRVNVIKLRKAGSHRNERSSFFVTILEIMLDKGEKMCGLFANCD